MKPSLRFLPLAAALAACGTPNREIDGGLTADVPLITDGPTVPDGSWITCQVGQQRCYENIHQTCRAAGEFTRVEAVDCAEQGLVCVPDRWCTLCQPGATRCTENSLSVEVCAPDGQSWQPDRDCDLTRGEACRGGRCVVLCNDDSVINTNIGCEYYGVDLDNIVETGGRSAASQQYSIVVSNPDPVLTARVEIHRNNAPPGMPPQLERVGTAVIPPRDLEVFELAAREVDCSTVAGLNDGTGTCLSSRAYRVTSNYPVISYQFNPLENVSVFSNDASLLVPTNSLDGNYRVIGWPQQWSVTDDPETNGREEIRAFMTIVGTQANTRVEVNATADIIPGGPLRMRQPAGMPFAVTLGPFDVLNLETGAFLADFTGSQVTADKPVAVFSGTECSDVPFWRTSAERQPACDHIEEQLFPAQTIGQRYVASRSSPRTTAVTNAGAMVAQVNEPEWFRVMNPGSAPVHVETTLPTDINVPGGPTLEFDLEEGESYDIRALADFVIRGNGRVSVAQFMGSQNTTGIPLTLPGGDPSMIVVPPVEQWRSNYVFLTPNKYAFDFVQIVARPSAVVYLGDGLNETPVADFADCTRSRSDGCIETPRHECPPPVYVTYRCQLSFPRINSATMPPTILPGRQGDGVHTVRAEPAEPGMPPETVMVLVSGFDRYVSYAYAGGTNLTPIR
jgi:hypothetical protein